MRCVHALCLVALVGAAQPAPEHHKYVIVGAGPGGLQIGHFLQSAGRDYVILDKHDAAGSFFLRYPRWRQLISINKPNTGRSDSFDFNSRHDWNSLLGEPSHSGAGQARTTVPCPGTLPQDGVDCHASSFSSSAPERTMATVDERTLFAHYAGGVYYPNADALASFLQAWSNGSLPSVGPALNILTNTEVVRVDRPGGYTPKPSRVSGGDEEEDGAWPRLAEVANNVPRFHVTVVNGGRERTLSCTYLIWAGGLQEPVQPHGVNTVEAIAKGWVRTYSTASTRVEDYFNKSVLLLGRGNAAFEFANHVLGTAAFVHLVGQRKKRISQAIETHYPGDVRHIHSNLLETYLLKSMDGMAETTLQYLQYEPEGGGSNRTWVKDMVAPCRLDAHGRTKSNCLFRRPYDHVIVCAGWRMARGTSLFSESTQPAVFTNGKHPSVSARYESKNVPGLFFAGNLAHAPDFKKSSGGFIHGFRYTARALHRELEEEEQAAAAAVAARRRAVSSSGAASAEVVGTGTGWPRVAHAGIRAVTEALLRRMNHAAGPYQMFGSLGDVLVLPPLTAEAATGFGRPDMMSPFAEPWSFAPAPGAEPGLINVRARPSSVPGPTLSQIRSDAVLNAAMSGSLFEELPVRLAEHKVAGWSAQLAAAAGQAARTVRGLDLPLTARGLLGTEYIVLTLEFGAAAGLGGNSSTATLRDPFALSRANVGLHNPEASHFLHPVLRYFHTGLPGKAVPADTPLPYGVSPPTALYPGGLLPLAEAHVIEDFWATWDIHATHVLPLARFLQDVATRRAMAVLALAGKSGKATGSVATSGGGGTLAGKEANKLLRSAWSRTPRVSSSLHHSEAVVEFAGHQGSMLYVRGRAVEGGHGWFERLSVDALEGVLHTGPRMLFLHFTDPDPRPLSAAEVAWTADRVTEAADSFAFEPPPVPMTSAEAEAAASTASRYDTLWRRLSGKMEGLLLVAVPCRAGKDRKWMNSLIGEAAPRLAAAAHCGSNALLLLEDGEVSFAGNMPADDGQLETAIKDMLAKGAQREATTMRGPLKAPQGRL
jgi:hypothetical protein